jgi:hypothetical protein
VNKLEIVDENAVSQPQAPTNDVVIDSLGRRLKIKEINPLQESRLVRGVGGEAAANIQYMLGYVLPVASVVMIDDDPVPFPTTLREVEALISRLGRAGLSAAQKKLMESSKDEEEVKDEIKN